MSDTLAQEILNKLDQVMNNQKEMAEDIVELKENQKEMAEDIVELKENQEKIKCLDKIYTFALRDVPISTNEYLITLQKSR